MCGTLSNPTFGQLLRKILLTCKSFKLISMTEDEVESCKKNGALVQTPNGIERFSGLSSLGLPLESFLMSEFSRYFPV